MKLPDAQSIWATGIIMHDQLHSRQLLAERQKRADLKVRKQEEIVRRHNGSASGHPEDQQLLVEMKQNKAVIDLARALFDYEQAAEVVNDRY